MTWPIIPDDASEEEIAGLVAEAKAVRELQDVERLLRPATCPMHGWTGCMCSGPPDYGVPRRLIAPDDRIGRLINLSLTGFLTVSERAELDAEARRRGFR